MSNRPAPQEGTGTKLSEYLNAINWAATPLGPRPQWPQNLQTAVHIMLGLHSPTALYWGRDFTLLYNDAFARLIGAQHPYVFALPAQQALSQIWPAAQTILQAAFAGESTEGMDAADVAPWLSASPSPIFAADGSVAGVMHNLTHQATNLEQALHSANERGQFLERALAHMGDYVYVWDRHQRFIYANERLQVLWGVADGDYRGKTLTELGFAAELEQKLTAQVEQVLNTGRPASGVESYTSPTGVSGHYEYIFNPLLGADGEVQFVAGVSRDVSDRQRASEALRKSEQRYRALFESIAEGFCIFEMLVDDNENPVDYRWLEINPAFERHTGLRDAVGRTARELVPTLEPHWLKIYGDVALTGVQHRFVEHSAALGRWFEVDAFRIGDPEERKVGLLFVDITKRVNAEASLKEADERKDEFLATLAHELRNPLAAIRSGLEVLKLGQDNPAADRTRPLATMERQTHQLVNLVDDLLEVSRVTRGTLELRKQQVYLADIVTNAIESCQPLIDTTGHTLTLELPDEPIPLHADPQRLSQVLSNLLSNAAKYTPGHGKITLAAQVQNQQAVITVADTGIGIAADKLNHIFQMFVQIDGEQRRTNQGLGVGLALAKSLVTMHGGQISVTSDGLGLGSRFTVHLPLSPHAQLKEVETLQPKTEDTNGHRVLIVDDNADAASTLSMLIEMLGNTVATADSGQAAIALAEEFRPQIIFMDLGMPEMDGFAAAKRIRETPWGREIFIVALSGWGQDEDKRKTKEAGFDHHLVKPTELSELKKLLAQVG